MNKQNIQRWDIWHARFTFSEGSGYKYRPVIVVEISSLGNIVMMVTSATNKLKLPHDYLIQEWKEAGLEKPSIARVDRIIEIPINYLGSAGYIGHLKSEDIQALNSILYEIVHNKDSDKN